MKLCKRSLMLLCVALVIVLAGSIVASCFNGFNGVKVSRINFDAANGTLSGLLYMPKDASESNPKPTVIVTHGYLNSAEMQDLNAIELSRRGYVVLALDQYDHGHSDLDDAKYSDTSFFGVWLPFWANSMHDAVTYMYEQPYVLKDAQGNGIIGVTGHSMGGFGSTMAIAMDEQAAAATGIRKVYCGITEGSDFMYTAYVGVDAKVADALGGGRTMGKICAQYDEFFFNDPAEQGGTVRHKDFVSTPDGMTFLQTTEPAQANTWYETTDGGKRIVYQPAETHPWNHFSTVSAGYVLDFYGEAFKDYQQGITAIPSTEQVWMWKEIAEGVALIGFVMLIIAVASIVVKLPFFNKANTGALASAPGVTGKSKVITIVVLTIAMLLPAIFFTPLMDEGAGTATVNILFYAGIVAGVIGLAAVIGYFVKKCCVKALAGGIVTLIAGAALALVAKTAMYTDNGVWTAIGINSITYWTLACALISLTIMGLMFLAFKAKEGATLASYGVVLKPVAILASLAAALVSVAVAYGVLWLMDALFLADFRFWTFAFKTFDANILPAILRYLPTFLLYYIVSTAAITINTNTDKQTGVKGYLLAIALNAAGPMLWLIAQYGMLFANGVAANPGSALSGIMMVAMVPTLSIAAIFSRNLYKKTGNIWTPAFLNAILMTTMTLANTMVAFK